MCVCVCVYIYIYIYIYIIGYTMIILSRRLTLHLLDSSSICQHLKKYNCLNATYRNILVNNIKILHSNNNVKK